jgi:hypothetical protein
MAFFGNFPTSFRLAGPKIRASPPHRLRGLEPGADAKLEGFRKTAFRFRAAPS